MTAHLPGWLIGRRHLVHRLMKVRIELLALRRELLHAIFLKDLHELAFGKLDTLDQRLHLWIGSVAQIGADRLERPMHIVGDRQHVAPKPRNAIDPRIENLPFRAFAQVLHFGKRAQQLVLELRCFSLGLGDRIGGFASRRLIRFAAAIASAWRAVGSVIVINPSSANIRMPRISGLRHEKSSV